MSFPFTAVVGHDDLRLALLLNAVHPGIGGVLVRGEKGTAKSTAVRALAALLPPQRAVRECRFSCHPDAPDPECPDGPHATDTAFTTDAAGERPARLVELPVGATEDRLVGSLDLERALTEGVRAYQPGLLADAHRGVLYVDEVNLLHDHLVDLLLDAAAMGRSFVERDGVSVSHAAQFLLVGTMNPEEGELRPQLLDRFGLTVEVRAARDVATRTEVIRRRLAYEADADAFAAAWRAQEAEVAERIPAAQARLASVVLPDAEVARVAAVCAAFDVDGMRADLVIARTAIAHAAWRGSAEVTEDDVRVGARLALPHRRRRDPFDEPGVDDQALDDALREAGEQRPDKQRPDEPPDEPPDDDPPGGGAPTERAAEPAGTPENGAPARTAPGGDGSPQPLPAPTASFRARLLEVPGIGEGAPGRRSRARTEYGRVVRPSASNPRRVADIHLPATLLAAAPSQRARGRAGPGLTLRVDDLRFALREGREGNLVLFVVDASGSMAARQRMAAVRGAVLSLLRDAYQRRDKVGLVTFRAGEARVVLPPTSSVPAAVALLAGLRTGGRTPLADGLLLARRVLAAERVRDPRRRPLLVLMTDGRATVAARPDGNPVQDALRAAGLLATDGVATVVVDCESGPIRLGLAGQLGVAAGAALVTVEELSADRVAGVVRAARAA